MIESILLELSVCIWSRTFKFFFFMLGILRYAFVNLNFHRNKAGGQGDHDHTNCAASRSGENTPCMSYTSDGKC